MSLREDNATERQIQNALYYYLVNSFEIIFPNMDIVTSYEADILGITRAGYAYEYEIKTSLSDFRADRKKREKHATLAGTIRRIEYPPAPWVRGPDYYVMADAPDDPREALRYQCFPDRRPKQFWYVLCGFSVPNGELPEYAGLMTYDVDKNRFFVIKAAPNLPALKVSQERMKRALRNMLYRYWQLRLKDGPGRTDDCPE
jgi:hypothetical protein